MRADFNRVAMSFCALLMIAMVSTAYAETDLVFETSNGHQFSSGKDEVLFHMTGFDYDYHGQIHLIEIPKNAYVDLLDHVPPGAIKRGDDEERFIAIVDGSVILAGPTGTPKEFELDQFKIDSSQGLPKFTIVRPGEITGLTILIIEQGKKKQGFVFRGDQVFTMDTIPKSFAKLTYDRIGKNGHLLMSGKKKVVDLKLAGNVLPEPELDDSHDDSTAHDSHAPIMADAVPTSQTHPGDPLSNPRLKSTMIKDKDGEDVPLKEMLLRTFTPAQPLNVRAEEFTYFQSEIESALIGLNMRKGGSIRVTGAPGTGKSYFADVLVSYIKTKQPGSESLQDRIYLHVNASRLSGGTQYTGAFEERMNALKRTAEIAPVTLVIDEMHTLVGAGAHSQNSNDFYQYIKTELASGRIKIIGTTTSAEWQKYFAHEQALIDRFPVEISLKEPSAEKMMGIVKSFLLNEYPNTPVQISDKTIEQFIGTASRFDPIGANPRKTLRLLDYSISAAEIGKKNSIENADVVRYASILYGYDISGLTPHRVRENLARLGATMDQSIVGSDPAKLTLRKALANHFFLQADSSSSKPFAAIVYGQRGTGKTTLARVTAEGLGYGTSKIMMGDYSHPSQVSAFKSRLAILIRQNPYQVIVLDELEKCDAKVQQSLLQVLEDGRFEANISETQANMNMTVVDASKIIFIATTNAGQDLANQSHTRDQFEAAAQADGINSFLLDRIYTEIPIPNPTKAAVQAILEMKLNGVLQIFKQKGYNIEIDRELLKSQMLTKVTQAAAQEPTWGFGVGTKTAGETVMDVSVRALERELKKASEDLSTYFIEHPEARVATLTLHNGDWQTKAVQKTRPMSCGELFH
jgi:replication-associated recombination protein RarA